METDNRTVEKKIYPLIAMRGLTIFPYMTLPFDIGRDKSVKALEASMESEQLVVLVTQKDAQVDSPEENEIYNVGTLSKIKQVLKLPGDTIRVLVEGLNRAKIENIVQIEPYFKAEISEPVAGKAATRIKSAQLKAMKRQVITAFEEYAKLSGKINPDTVFSIAAIDDFSQIADVVTAHIPFKTEQKQQILEEFNALDRMKTLLRIMAEEVEILGIEREISFKVHKQIDKMQKDYYLREQMKIIQHELGEMDGSAGEMNEYREKLKQSGLPQEAEKKVLKELDRLMKLPPGSPEGSVIRTYVDWLLDLPWNKRTEEIIDLDRAKQILEEDHYGLEKVKERILDYLAVRKMKNNLKGPILCLIGPPGVGKTSIAKSIARALNRNYVRMSLGGVKDEAEIRGHRRTYIGAMPGRIISAIKQSDSNNPLILLDEIDKMGNDYRGDPASAMLEVLDSEQNYSFRDHYIEVPFPLTDVMFITTANNVDNIPKPLQDRMEMIEISGYTEEEKVQIALRHLIPKQLAEHGLLKSRVVFNEAAVRSMILYYTRESGVRNLEREIAAACRKTARHLLSNGIKKITLNAARIEEFLGTKRFRRDRANEKDEIGVATGLAWTPAGGDTLSIEATLMEGNGTLELTGQLGDIMKESAKTALSYVRSRVGRYNIDKDFHKKYDIHIHVPEGAIPKDGPSAGITLAVALVSALAKLPVSKDVAMTGEITLRGRVLPVGGLTEKILAANRVGIHRIILPEENKKD
ncbi:MAG: endopeptidase La, partial [Eubacteriales bacterium]|nr:endopeptidase La [Eubacteriales bacterium]